VSNRLKHRRVKPALETISSEAVAYQQYRKR